VRVIDVNRQQQLTSLRPNEANARLIKDSNIETRKGEKINCKWKTASPDGKSNGWITMMNEMELFCLFA
jgi:hypothetical protein